MKIHHVDHTITNAFIRLSNQPLDIDTDTLEIINYFIYQRYGLVCTQVSSDKALRVKHQTVTPDITLRDLVPSSHGILLHYQTL